MQLGRVDEIELVNKEMYSSRVRAFVVKGRQAHPKKDGHADYTRGFDSDSWQLIGNFTADNKKGSQVFKAPVRLRVRWVLEIGWVCVCVCAGNVFVGVCVCGCR